MESGKLPEDSAGPLVRRIATAYWLIAYGCIKTVSLVGLAIVHFNDRRFPIADASVEVIVYISLVASTSIAFVIAGIWMKAAKIRGHYLAAATFGLVLPFALISGATVEALVAFGFLALLVSDIRESRGNGDFSLTADELSLFDFRVVPWLTTAAVVSLFGRGDGAVPAIILHVLSPAIIFFANKALRSHPRIRGDSLSVTYNKSLKAWIVFYVISLILGLLVFWGMSEIATQGMGR